MIKFFKNKQHKRILSYILVFLLCFSMIPSVNAASPSGEIEAEDVEPTPITKNHITDDVADYNAALTHILYPENNLTQEYVDSVIANTALNSGVYISETSAEVILGLINSISPYQYHRNENGYLSKDIEAEVIPNRSELFSTKLDQMIASENVIVLDVNTHIALDTVEGIIVSEMDNYTMIRTVFNGTNCISVLNPNYFQHIENNEKLNQSSAALLISILLNDENITDLFLEECVTEAEIEKQNAIQEKLNNNSIIDYIDSGIMPFGYSTYTRVYGGPGSTCYAVVGSVGSTTDALLIETVTVLGTEEGYNLIVYNTGSGYKSGYAPTSIVFKNNNTVVPNKADDMSTIEYTGYLGTALSSTTVYGYPSNSGASMGSLSSGETITILCSDNTNIDSNYCYIEYSTSNGTKRGFVQASKITQNNNTTLAKVKADDTITYEGPALYHPTSGELFEEEYVVITAFNSDETWARVNYNTNSGRKTAYVKKENITVFKPEIGGATTEQISVFPTATMTAATDVYAGPAEDNYAKIGSVSASENVGIINKENGWFIIQYATSSGPKRGAIPSGTVNNSSSFNVEDKTGDYTGYKAAASEGNSKTIYTGPSNKYATAGSVASTESLTVFAGAENGYLFCEYSTPAGTKRGYILVDNIDDTTIEGATAISNSTDDITSYHLYSLSGAAVGKIYPEEYIVILESGSSSYYVEYNSTSGRKRGYIAKTYLTITGSSSSIVAMPDNANLIRYSSEEQSVYSGPSSSYYICGTIYEAERVTIVKEDVFGYSYIQFTTPSGDKRGYVPSDTVLQFENEYSANVRETILTGGTVYGQSAQGHDLKYFTIGTGSKALFLTYAIHGFEDGMGKAWDRDGFELVKMAEQVYNHFSNSELTNGWTIYIFPCLNPDGMLHGTTHDGPGRCTTHYYADENATELTSGNGFGVDMNRCFPTGFVATTSSRNFTTNSPLATVEARAIATTIQTLSANHTGSSQYFIDTHGWTTQLIGDSSLTSIFDDYFTQNSVSTLSSAQGYIARWAQSLGMQAMLFEFPANAGNQYDGITNLGYDIKYINALEDILETY